MPSVSDFFGGQSLKAEDLPHNTSVPVVIESVTPREFDDGRKLEIAFRGKQKVLVCNRTNASSIWRVTGEQDYERWPGKTVYLVRTTTDFQGRRVECIRIDENPPARPASQMPSAPAAESAPQHDAYAAPATVGPGAPPADDIPF